MKASHLELWRHELDAFLIYRVLAQIEHANAKGELFKKLAQESLSQASIWKEKAGSKEAPYRPGLKLKLVLVLLRVLGPSTKRDHSRQDEARHEPPCGVVWHQRWSRL